MVFRLVHVASCLWVVLGANLVSAEYLPGIEWPEPAVVTPGQTNAQPPSDAVVLFDGKDLSSWNGGESWPVVDGIATCGEKSLYTKQKFGDCQLHIEWSVSTEQKGSGQQRGNSGVFFMPHRDEERGLWCKYEVQILDSYKNKTYFDGQAAALYRQQPPAVNVVRPPGEWNTYDIVFLAPRFNEDKTLKTPAYITLIHNGVLVHNHQPLKGYTSWKVPSRYVYHADRLPIGLQNHNGKVHFRNIWLREIKPPLVGKQVEPPKYRKDGKTWLASEADHTGKPVEK